MQTITNTVAMIDSLTGLSSAQANQNINPDLPPELDPNLNDCNPDEEVPPRPFKKDMTEENQH